MRPKQNNALKLNQSSKSIVNLSTGSLQRDTTSAFQIPLAGDSFGRGKTLPNLSEAIDDEEEFMRDKVTQLTNDNSNLRCQLDSTLNEVSFLKNQQLNYSDHIQNIKDILSEKEPNFEKLFEEAMKHEIYQIKIKQDAKEQKVLEILQFKDRQIDDLQKRLSESETQLSNLRLEHSQILTKQTRLSDKLEQAQKKVRQLELELAESKDMLEDYSQTDLIKSKAQLQSQLAYIRDLESQVKSPSNESALQVIDDLNQQLKLKDVQINDLTKKLDDTKQTNTQIQSKYAYLQDQINILRNEVKDKQVLSQDLNSMQFKQSQAIKQLQLVLGSDAQCVDIEVTATEIVNVVQKIQNQYLKLEAEMQNIIDSSQMEVTKIGESTQSDIYNQNLLLKEQVNQLTAELRTLREVVNKSTLGGGSEQQVISRDAGSNSTQNRLLNHKLQQMKVREDQLVDQISVMKQKMKYQSSYSDQLATDQDSQSENADSLALRVGELEHVIFKQREQNVNLEQQLIAANRKLQEQQTDQLNKIELLELRNKNLLQLTKNQSISDQQSKQLAGSQQSDRTRRQSDLTIFELNHKCSELTVLNTQLQKQEKSLISQCDTLLIEIAKLKHEMTLKEAGLQVHDSQLTVLIQDQKQRIQQLEQQVKPQLQTQDMTLIGIRDEYLQKVEQINQAVESERQQQTSLVISQNQKIENLKAQLGHMEKKEMKQNEQIKQLKDQLDQKRVHQEQRSIEVEALIESKNQLIQALEKDVAKKEKTLTERQEQLSVLLTAMDSNNSNSNDHKQKLTNLAAEVCNLLADKSSLELKVQELLKQQQVSHQSLSKCISDKGEAINGQVKLQSKLKDVQSQLELQERKLTEIENQNLDLQTKLQDQQFTNDRNIYIIKQKEEIIAGYKQQLQQSETSFRESLQKLKQSVLSKPVIEQTKSKRDNGLRVAIQKLHLGLVDRDDLKPHEIISELEQALLIAATTIERLQSDVDSGYKQCQMLQQEWDAFGMNQTLLIKYESALAMQQKIGQIVQDREVDQAQFVKRTIDYKLNQVVKDLEHQLESLQLENIQNQEEIQKLKSVKHQLGCENESLKQQVISFEDVRRQEREAMILKAEISVDSRYKSKEDQLKSMFDNRNLGNDDLVREVCAYKLQIMNLKKNIEANNSTIESLELALKSANQAQSESQVAINQLNVKLQNLQNKYAVQSVQSTSEQDRLKKVNFKLEKDLIRQNELTNYKANELSILKEKYEVQLTATPVIHQADLSRKIQELQEELIDLRQNRMLEIDELRLEYEIQVAEAKKGLSQQERKYNSANQPADLIDQNQDLKEQLQHYQHNEQVLKQQNEALRQQCQEYEQHAENMSKEVEDIKLAMIQVESAVQGSDDNILNSQGPSLQLTDSKRSKSAVKRNGRFNQSQATIQTASLSQMQQRDFIRNPPMLVKALIQSKINEQTAKSKLRRQLSTEVHLRQQISQKLPQSELVSDLINQNEAILQILNQQIGNGYSNTDETYEDQHIDDYNCLVISVLALSSELAKFETNQSIPIGNVHDVLPLSQVVQAQRIVIRALTEKNDRQIRYVPEREKDRKIWYLELLESQVNDAENQTDRLVDFIKRLQVAVSGNLQSAAEIRATSIDLANNTKEASEEIKTLRHVATLIKHDLQQSMQQQTTVANPFQEPDQFQRGTLTHKSSHQSLDKVMTERDSAQNQLSLTSKIKQSLEQELINIKLQHANDMQSHIQQYRNLQRELQESQQNCEQQEQKLHKLGDLYSQKASQCETLSNQVQDLEQQLSKAIQKAEKQSGSTTSLRKLQQDMQEWRKMSDNSLKTKQDALDQALAEIQKIKGDQTRLKSENLMLRRVQQDHRNGEDVSAFLKEIDQLKQQYKQLETTSNLELDKLTGEKQQLQDRIVKLEELLNQGESQANKEAQQLMKKVTFIQHEVKSKQSDLTQLKDQLAQQQLEKIKLEDKLQDALHKKSQLRTKIDDLQNTCKQLQLEKDEMFKQRMQSIENKDNCTAQIAEEMISLRDTFMQLKQERDALYEQLSINQSNFDRRDKEWRTKVADLEVQIQKQQSTSKHQTESESTIVLQERNKALMNDLKYFKEQSEKVLQKCNHLMEIQSSHDANILVQQQEQQALQAKLDEMRVDLKNHKQEIADKEHSIRQLNLQSAEQEAEYNAKLKSMQSQCHKVRIETQSQIQALAQQMQMIKQSRQSIDKKPVKEIDQALQVVQKEVQLKQVRKELQIEKQKVVKLKAQKAELKQLVNDQAPKGKKQAVVAIQTPKWKEDVLEMLSDQSTLRKQLKQMRDCNQLEAQVIDLTTQCQQLESNLFASQHSNEEMAIKLEDLQQVILEQKSHAKDGKTSLIEKHQLQVASLKEQVKQLQQELTQIKNEFVSPDETQPLLDQIKDYQQSIKQINSDLLRKNKLIASLRQQKDSANTELELVMQDLKGVKDENSRLQKQMREGKQSNQELREMRETYEWLQKQEKQMKEELVVLHEKNKSLRQDLTRKDSQLMQYKDQCHQKSKESETVKELTKEIDKLRDDKKRLKLELDISQNQIKTLRQQVEQFKIQPERNIGVPSEQELRTSKQKAKRYENVLRKSIQVISKVGSEIVRIADDSSSLQVSKTNRTTSSQDYLKDAGAILGVSMHELEDFINPTPGKSLGSSDSHYMLRKMQKLKDMPDTLDGDIEEIGEYCIKLLDEIQNQQ